MGILLLSSSVSTVHAALVETLKHDWTSNPTTEPIYSGFAPRELAYDAMPPMAFIQLLTRMLLRDETVLGRAGMLQPRQLALVRQFGYGDRCRNAHTIQQNELVEVYNSCRIIILGLNL